MAAALSTVVVRQNGHHFWSPIRNNLSGILCEHVCGELLNQMAYFLMRITQTVHSSELTHCSASHVSTYAWKASWVLLTTLIAVVIISSTVVLADESSIVVQRFTEQPKHIQEAAEEEPGA